MKVLKNTFNNKSALLNKTTNEQIEMLAEEFCNGMDYGYKIESVTKSDNGFYTVTVVCPNGAAASTRFIWHPENKTDYYVGESIDNKTWHIHPALLEDFKENVISV